MIKKLLILASIGLCIGLITSCQKVDPVAPEDAIMTISVNPAVINPGGDNAVITVIITRGDGYPVPDGTVVYLTTTLGTIDGRVTTTDGMARSILTSGIEVGIAEITVSSGVVGTAEPIIVQIGAAIASISLTATPASISFEEGATSSITAITFDENAQTIANAAITFSTDAGALDSGGQIVLTNESGEAFDTLTLGSWDKDVDTVTVTATAGAITSTIAIKVITPPNIFPTANFTYSPSDPKVGDWVTFNASSSYDPDGTIVKYSWEFGDTLTGMGKIVTHPYSTSGDKTVTLTVTDDDDATSSTSSIIKISTP